jgi:hypothetical protein
MKKEIEKQLKEMYQDKEFLKESLKIAKEWEFTLMDGLYPNERWEEFEN